MATSHPFTCNTCQVAFRGSDLQRTHMQSDWHRYNLKRRVASLPPLTSEIFAEKVLANKASAAATAARASFQKRCEVCDKSYFSEGAYVNHLGSQKHRALLARETTRTHGEVNGDTASMTGSTFSLGDPVEIASTQDGEDEDDHDAEQLSAQLHNVDLTSSLQTNGHVESASQAPDVQIEVEEDEDEDEEHVADLTKCLFCNHKSTNLDLNTTHMSRQHGFFVPEREYLVDLPGLISYLSETIHVLHECLYCHKTALSSAGAQTHMRDRGHCMMAYTTEDEQLDVGDFYDFRATYSDEESEADEHKAGGKVKLGARRKVVTTVEGLDGDEELVDDIDEDDWESGSDTSSTTLDEHTQATGRGKDSSRTDKTKPNLHDPSATAYHDDYELHLPSGRTAGHRSLRQYYKQHLRQHATGEDERQSRLLTGSTSDSQQSHSREHTANNTPERGRQLITARDNGGLGMIGVSEAKKREVRVAEKRLEKRSQRAAASYEWGKNKRANHQKHFRDHLLQ